MGEQALVEFWGADLNNDLKVNSSYLLVEKLSANGQWNPVYTDRDFCTKLTWKRFGVAYSKIEIQWDINSTEDQGYYRITHSGKRKYSRFGNTADYNGSSNKFYVGRKAQFAKQPNSHTNNLNGFALLVFPNPVINTLYVKLDKPSQCTVFNSMGKTVFKGEVSKDKPISTESLQPGVYSLITSNGQTAKFVKQ